MNINKYKYSKDKAWFLYSEIKNILHYYVNQSDIFNILEIGCFEGLSSIYFADFLLNNPKSSMICVDPFLHIENNDHQLLMDNTIEQNFNHNISVCNNSNKITVHKITSDAFFENNNETFNFIYIDGNHECDFILRDMENSFKVLKSGGIMWMDDYGGKDGIVIKKTMDSFLDKYERSYEIIHMGYQLAIRKK